MTREQITASELASRIERGEQWTMAERDQNAAAPRVSVESTPAREPAVSAAPVYTLDAVLLADLRTQREKAMTSQIMFSKSFQDECRTAGERHIINQRLNEISYMCQEAKLRDTPTAREQRVQAARINRLTNKAVDLDALIKQGFGRWRRSSKISKGGRKP